MLRAQAVSKLELRKKEEEQAKNRRREEEDRMGSQIPLLRATPVPSGQRPPHQPRDGNADAVLDATVDGFIEAYLLGGEKKR